MSCSKCESKKDYKKTKELAIKLSKIVRHDVYIYKMVTVDIGTIYEFSPTLLKRDIFETISYKPQ